MNVLRSAAYAILRGTLPPKVRYFARKKRLIFRKVRYKSQSENVFHCCVHKTASQWLRIILSDPRVYEYSGLQPFHYQTEMMGGIDNRKITDRSFSEPFPQKTLVSPLYCDFKNFSEIPKHDKYRAFFVMRDPRDIVVSWYFSALYSHPLKGSIPESRKKLETLSVTDGLKYTISYLQDQGVFKALKSWSDGPIKDPWTLIVRFEQLTDPKNIDVFKCLFEHCDIQIPMSLLKKVLEDYSFEVLSRGRKLGEENKRSKYRKGIHGDWKNYFDNEVHTKFSEVVGDLVELLKYK